MPTCCAIQIVARLRGEPERSNLAAALAHLPRYAVPAVPARRGRDRTPRPRRQTPHAQSPDPYSAGACAWDHPAQSAPPCSSWRCSVHARAPPGPGGRRIRAQVRADGPGGVVQEVLERLGHTVEVTTGTHGQIFRVWALATWIFWLRTDRHARCTGSSTATVPSRSRC